MANMRKIHEGLEILLRYEPDAYCQAEHDELFAGSTPPEKMQPLDVKALEDACWSWDESLPSWRVFT